MVSITKAGALRGCVGSRNEVEKGVRYPGLLGLHPALFIDGSLLTLWLGHRYAYLGNLKTLSPCQLSQLS